MHSFNRELADEPAILDRRRTAPSQTEFERIERLRADSADYAASLRLQLDVLVGAYDAVLARWTAERDALQHEIEKLQDQGVYIEELETDLLAAWTRIESVERLLSAAYRDAEYFRRELDAANRLGADRERRLTVALYEAQQSEKAAIARAEAESASADEARRARDEFRERAEWSADERARLARCYEDACAQAGHIASTLTALEQETRGAIAAKDAEIDALATRYAELETTLLEHLAASIREARAESERLSALVSGVQQGRVWSLKRAVHRLRGLFG